MAIVHFDTLAYSNKLQKAGLLREQAEANAGAFKDLTATGQLATKEDIANLKMNISSQKEDVSKPLSSLRDAGILESGQHGANIYYRLAMPLYLPGLH